MKWLIRQLWYCCGWMFDLRLWGVYVLYRWLNARREQDAAEMRQRLLRLEKQAGQSLLDTRIPVGGGYFPQTHKVIQEMIRREVLTTRLARDIVRKGEAQFQNKNNSKSRS